MAQVSSGNVHIGNHVWIGMNAVLLKNIEVQDNSIIGAGAVVSGKFSESNCILVGNPAKIVRRGINWGHENIIIRHILKFDIIIHRVIYRRDFIATAIGCVY